MTVIYVNEMTFRNPSKDGSWLPGEPTKWLDKLLFPKLLGGKRSWLLSSIISSHWFNKLCLCNNTFIKIPEVWDSELLSWWTRRCWEGGTAKKGMATLYPFSTSCLVHLFYLAIPELSVQFSLVQLLSHVQLFAIPWTEHTRSPCNLV